MKCRSYFVLWCRFWTSEDELMCLDIRGMIMMMLFKSFQMREWMNVWMILSIMMSIRNIRQTDSQMRMISIDVNPFFSHMLNTSWIYITSKRDEMHPSVAFWNPHHLQDDSWCSSDDGEDEDQNVDEDEVDDDDGSDDNSHHDHRTHDRHSHLENLYLSSHLSIRVACFSEQERGEKRRTGKTFMRMMIMIMNTIL